MKRAYSWPRSSLLRRGRVREKMGLACVMAHGDKVNDVVVVLAQAGPRARRADDPRRHVGEGPARRQVMMSDIVSSQASLCAGAVVTVVPVGSDSNRSTSSFGQSSPCVTLARIRT